MLEILSNGRAKNASAWDTKSVGTIEDLIEVLNEYTLNPVFEDYGNFINLNPQWTKTELQEKYSGCVKFFGNFLTYSHVFNIITDDKQIIEKLTEAIQNNLNTGDYKSAKADYLNKEQYKEEMKRKWINKEISYVEYNNSLI